MSSLTAWSKYRALYSKSINGQFSLMGFSFGLVFLFFVVCFFHTFTMTKLFSYFFWFVTFVGLLLHRICSYYSKPDQWPNVIRAFGLGSVFSLGWCLVIVSHSLETPRVIWPFGLYLAVLTFFHWSEYYVTALYNHPRCSVSIYMLAHSPEYLFALAFCVTEYWLETFAFHYLFSSVYHLPAGIHLFGFLVCVVMEVLRKISMATAAGNFNHFVEHRPRDDHVLVTSGAYAYFRHPAYVGWYYWSLGTQLLLGNPLSLILFSLAGYYFFSERIEIEERSLVSFFGDAYRQYQDRVGTGIPFVRGYQSRRVPDSHQTAS